MAESLGSAQADVLINIDKALGSLDRLESRLNGMGNAGASGLAGFDKQVTSTSSKLLGTADKIESQYRGAGTAMAVAGGAGLAVFGLAVNTAGDFQAQLSGVAASLGGVGTASGITEDQFSSLHDEALRIGSTTSKSASEAAQAMDLMAKAGVGVTTILDGGAQAAVNLSEATGSDLATSAETVAATMNLFADSGLTAAQSADILTVGMNASSATMSEFQTGLARLAPTIVATGMGLDEAAANIAFFNAKGLSAAEVGTSLQSVFASVTNPTDEAAGAMKELGINAFDTQGNFVGFPALFDQFQTATAGMTDEQRAQALASFLQADALDVATIASKEGGDGVRGLTEDMNQQGAAAESAKQRMDNFNGSMEQLKGAVETLMIQIGEVLLPVLQRFVDFLAKIVSSISTASPTVLKLATIIGVLASGFLALAGGAILVAPAILRGVSSFMQLAKGIQTATVAARAFLLANPWILAVAAAIALFAIAYKTNFLGFGDAVDHVIDKIQRFVDVFKSSFDLLSNTGKYDGITAAFRALGFAIGDLLGWNLPGIVTFFTGLGKAINRPYQALKKIASAFGALGKALAKGDFSAAFDALKKGFAGIGDLLASPAKAVGSFLKGITTGFAPLDSVLHGAGAIFTDFGRLIQEVFQGDISGAVEVGQRLLGHFIDYLGSLGSLAIAAISALGSAIVGAAGAIDWGALVSGAADLAGKAITAMGTLADKVVTWVTDAAIGLPWSDLIDGAKDLAASAITNMGSLAEKVAAWITDAAADLPWSDIVSTGADAITGIGTKVVGLIIDGFSAALTGLSSLLSGVGAYLLANIGALDSVLEIGRLIVGKIIDGFSTALSGLVAIVQGIGGYIVSNIGDLGAVLEIGRLIVGKIIDGFSTALTGLAAIVKGIGSFVAGAVGGLGEVLSIGASIVGKIIDGISSALPGLSALVGGFITVITGAFKFGTELFDKGAELVQTLIGGLGSLNGPLQTTVDTIVGIVTGIKDAIAGVISDAAGVLGLGGGGDDTGAAKAKAAEDAANSLEAAQGRIEAAITGINNALAAFDVSAAEDAFTLGGASLAEKFKAALTTDAGGILETTGKLGADVGASLVEFNSACLALGEAAGLNYNTGFGNQMGLMVTSVSTFTSAAGVTLQGFIAACAAYGDVAGVNFKTGLSAGLADAITSVNLFVSFATDNLNDFASDAGTAGEEAGSSFATNLGNGMNEGASNADSAISSIIRSIDRLAGAASSAYSYGAAISQGVANGINSALGAVIAAADGIVAAVDKAITAKAKIASPSKLTYGRGKQMAEGLINALGDALPDIDLAFERLFSAPTADPMQAFSSIPAPQGTTTYIQNTTILALKSEDWVNTIKQVENSSSFIEGLEQSIAH